MQKNLLLRILLLLLLVSLAAYVFFYFDLIRFFQDRHQILQFIKSYHPYDELAFILLQIIQVVAAPIPGELSGIIGGYLYGPFWGTVYSTIGLTIGSWIAFLLARFFGEPLLEKVVKKEVFDKFEHFMENKGLLVSFLLFLIPGFPKDYLCYIMGVSLIPTGTFIMLSAAGRILGTIMLSVTGAFAGNGQYILLSIILALGIVISIATYYYRDRLLEIIKSRKE
jgi:uncharacterized membrane protein YdjX (TVP38/TMEM64 family)